MMRQVQAPVAGARLHVELLHARRRLAEVLPYALMPRHLLLAFRGEQSRYEDREVLGMKLELAEFS